MASHSDLEPARLRQPARRGVGGIVRSAVNRPPRADAPPTRRRGWVGRGSVGLVAETPPKYLTSKEARSSGYLWRFLTGVELDGKQRSNATWLRWGNRQYIWSVRAPATNWVMWPRALRAVARMAGAALAWITWDTYMRHPAPVTWMAGVGVWLALFAVGWLVGDSLLLWRHRRQWVWPLAQVLVRLFGYHPRTSPRRFLWVPSDFRQRGLKIALPPTWTGVDDESERSDEGEAQAKAVVAAARVKLALGDIETTWRLASDGHELVIVPRRDRIDTRVLFDGRAEAWIDETPLTSYLIGAGVDGPVRLDLDDDSPHLLLSMLSGQGKSVLLQSITAQVLHRGGEVTVLDFKQRSQKWAKDLPDVHYCRHPENMHLALIRLAMEGNRRNEIAWHWDGDGEPVQRRHLLVLEEANATVNKLQTWWELNRRKLDDADLARYCGPFGDPSLPKSPAVLALADILFMGRQSYINVAAVGQYTTAHAMGGPEIREMFGARGIKGPQKAFAMLAGELDRIPKQRGIKGRIHLVMHGQAVEVQVMFMTPEQAREWATSGDGPVTVTGSQGDPELVDQGIPVQPDTTPVIDVPSVEAGENDLVTLRQASSGKVVARTLASLRKHRHTDPTFPKPVVKAERRGLPDWYDRRELRLWHQNREDYREGDD